MTQVQSLSRTFSLLDLLAASDLGLSLTDLSTRAGLAPSTVHRLLNSLKHVGYVECEESTGLWSVGVQCFSVGNAFLKKRDYVARARPHMKELVKRTGETANLAILSEGQVLYVVQIESKEVMRTAVQIGSRGTLYATGVGKSMLSTLTQEGVSALLKGVKLKAFTPNTCTTRASLFAALEQARLQGCALDDEEQSAGLRCVAANIYDHFGEAIAAVSISGPSVRVTKQRIAKLSAEVILAANKITADIGGVHP